MGAEESEDGGWIHGPDCILEKLDAALASSSLIHRAIDLDFMASAGIHLTPQDIDVEELHVMRILKAERDRYQQEQIDKAQRNHG